MDDVVEDSVSEIVGISSNMVLDSEHLNWIVKSTIVTWMKSCSLMLMLDPVLNAVDTCQILGLDPSLVRMSTLPMPDRTRTYLTFWEFYCDTVFSSSDNRGPWVVKGFECQNYQWINWRDTNLKQSLTIKGCVRVSVCNVITQLSHWLSE